MNNTIKEMQVETALINAVKKRADFYQIAGAFESIIKKYIHDRTKQQELMAEIAELIQNWDPKTRV